VGAIVKEDIMKLTVDQLAGLKLVERSEKDSDGWVLCNPKIFKALLTAIPTDLMEFDRETKRIRLTKEGKTVLKWR